MIDEDLVLYAVTVGGELGSDYVEARYHSLTSTRLSARNGAIIGVQSSAREGIGVRVLVEGALAFASTNTLNREAVRASVERAYKQAKSASAFMKMKIGFSEERMGRARYEAFQRKSFDSADVADKAELHSEVAKRVADSVREAKVPTIFTFMGESVEEKLVANSDGAFVYSKTPRISFGYNMVVVHPQKGSIQRFFSYGASGGLEWIDEWNLYEAVPEEASTYEKVLLEGTAPPQEKIDVIVGSEIVGLIVHESCGHPSEADRILGREAAQAGKSFIRPGDLGERIGGQHATVIDDPTIPGSSGFYLFDDEGVPARPRYLYREGAINEFLHNRWTAKVFRVNSNASARSMDFRSEPIVRMANTYLKAGSYSFDELIEDVKVGVYMKSYMEWNIDDERWSQRYVGLEAYLVENGELKGFVRNPVLEVTTRTFYTNIDAADRNLKFYSGLCGKGEPAQGVPVWFGGPNVRLRGIRLGVAPA